MNLDRPAEEPSGLRLRPETAEDEGLLFELYASTRQEELNLTGWDVPTRSAFLEMQFRAMRQGYRAMFPRGEFSIILEDDTPVGRAVVDRRSEEIHLVDIIVLPSRRGHGIGKWFMRALCAEAKEQRKPVRLQALKNSRAVAFYQRLGFSIFQSGDLYEHLEWRERPDPVA